jgi:phosphoserine phosphatase RsbU/P
MSFFLVNIARNKKVKAFLLLFALLLIFRLIFLSVNSLAATILSEIIMLSSLIIIGLYLVKFIGDKKRAPLSLIMNVAVLNAIIFFLLTFSSNLFALFNFDIKDFVANPEILLFSFSFIVIVVIAVICVYTLLVFREFYFLGQNRESGLYYNLMLLFFILAALSNSINQYYSFNFVKNAFLVNSIILISFNSIKISWIAFLSKKEKMQLLFISVILIVLFGLNIHSYAEGNSFLTFLLKFSPAVYQLLSIVMIYGVIYFGILFFTTLFHIPTAEAFDRKATEVSSLQNFSALISQVFDLGTLADTVTELALKAANADASWIIWIDNNGFKPTSKKFISFTDATLISEIIIAKNNNETIKTSMLLNVKKEAAASGLSEKYFNLIVSPLKTHSAMRGFLIAGKKDNMRFDEEALMAINTFSEYASVAIENSKLVEESIEKERLERELEVARDMQQKILPQSAPQIEGLEISTVFIPAFEVGGDYYDFFEIKNNKLGFTIADVSGKGISAAFIMAEIKGIFESLSKLLDSPKAIFVQANQILKKSLNRKSFVSAIYGIFDPATSKLQISRAGHTPIILLRNNEIENLQPSGLGLGLDFTNNFESSLEEMEFTLQENDVIVLYTDGVTEAKNSLMEDFGTSMLEKVIFENRNNSTDDISRNIIQEVTLFSKNNHQHDDITLVILRWKYKNICTEINNGRF